MLQADGSMAIVCTGVLADTIARRCHPKILIPNLDHATRAGAS